MRRFGVAVWASLVLGGVAACGPLAQGAQPGNVSLAPGGPTPGTTSPAAGQPRVLMDESFAQVWPDDPRASAWFAEDGYRLSAHQPGEFVAVRAPLADVPRDVIVSGTFRKLGGPPGGGYGLILEDQRIGAGDGIDQSGEFVVAEVGDRGEVGIWRRDGKGWTDLLPWTPSRAVHPDTVANDLTVELLGGRLTFRVNGDQVADLAGVETLALPPGAVGIFTGGDLNEVVVNRFRVEAPEHAVGLSPAPAQAPPPQPIPQGRPSAAPAAAQQPPGNVPDLLAGIADDMGAIAASFSGGLDNPHDPVSDPIALKQDAVRLAAATQKANGLLAELERMHNGAPGDR